MEADRAREAPAPETASVERAMAGLHGAGLLRIASAIGNRAFSAAIAAGVVAVPSKPLVQRDPIGGPARIGRLEESDEPYVAVDGLAWLGSLLLAGGWAIAAGVSGGQGQGGVALLHNMFGGGAPLEVEPEWVQAALAWKSGYLFEAEAQLRKAAQEDAIPAAQSGGTSGEGHVAGKAEAYSRAAVSCWSINPRCPGADQFYASGNAHFHIEASYRWTAPDEGQREAGYNIDVELYDLRVEYEDFYVWRHAENDPVSRMQKRGWTTPFKLHAEWEEPGPALQVVMSNDAPPRIVEL